MRVMRERPSHVAKTPGIWLCHKRLNMWTRSGESQGALTPSTFLQISPITNIMFAFGRPFQATGQHIEGSLQLRVAFLRGKCIACPKCGECGEELGRRRRRNADSYRNGESSCMAWLSKDSYFVSRIIDRQDGYRTDFETIWVDSINHTSAALSSQLREDKFEKSFDRSKERVPNRSPSRLCLRFVWSELKPRPGYWKSSEREGEEGGWMPPWILGSRHSELFKSNLCSSKLVEK